MTPPVIIIDNNDQFLQSFKSLNSNTIVNCRLRLIPGEEHLLVDLLERGITLIPSATSQLASRSKVHQARILNEFMLPHTTAVYDSNSLLQTITDYNRAKIKQVVVKRDRKNGGIGIHRFESIEDVYNLAEFGNLTYPFVIQPYIEKFLDLRVIILDEYIEAYSRSNTNNFRHNLHCGGISTPHELHDELRKICRDIMQRAAFPYAHVDLMVLPDGKLYLTEINLRGGLRGARIDANEYRQRVDRIHEEKVRELTTHLR